MAETYTLDAQARTIVGKKVSQIRAQGLVPAVIYGSKVEPISVQIPYRPLQLALAKAGGTHLIEINVDGASQTVLTRQVQRDVIRGDILHVDFFALDMNEVIRTEVPLRFINISPAVEQRRGLLLTGLNTLTIEALPRDLISIVEVDIAGLNEIGDSIHVRDLSLPDTLTIIDDGEEMIVRVIPVPITLTDDEQALADGTITEPELIAKRKEEAEEEE